MRTTPASRWVCYTVLVIPFVVSFFTRFAPSTLAGAISGDLRFTPTELGVATSTYFYVYTLMQVPSGILIDRYGVRKTVAAGTAVCAVGLGLYADANSLAVASTASAVIGFGSSVTFLGILRAVEVLFSGAQFASVAGLTLLLGNLGSIASGRPLAALLNVASWRLILGVVGALCLLSAIAVLAFARVDPPRPSSTIAARSSGQPADTQKRVTAAALLRDKNLLLLGLCAVGTNATFYTFTALWGTSILQSRRISFTEATTISSVALLVYGVVSLAVGRVTDRSTRKYALAAVVSGAAVAGWCGLFWSTPSDTAVAIVGIMLTAAAAGSVVVPFAIISERYSRNGGATALSIVNGMVFLGVAILEQLVGALTKSPAVLSAPNSHALGSFRPGLGTLLVVSFIGLSSVLWAYGARNEPILPHEQKPH